MYSATLFMLWYLSILLSTFSRTSTFPLLSSVPDDGGGVSYVIDGSGILCGLVKSLTVMTRLMSSGLVSTSY
ncbi:hypothetical protein BGZ57DRAFT_919195 [Hyaloscypha finlandica]|nr:hypothetical protein BGZ57DRAFT_919195 [Hyaloscypha finlandica]